MSGQPIQEILSRAISAPLSSPVEYRLSQGLVGPLFSLPDHECMIEASALRLFLLHVGTRRSHAYRPCGQVVIRDQTINWKICAKDDPAQAPVAGVDGSPTARYRFLAWLCREKMPWADPVAEPRPIGKVSGQTLATGMRFGSWTVLSSVRVGTFLNHRVVCRCGRLETRFFQEKRRVLPACNHCRGVNCLICGTFFTKEKFGRQITCSPECHRVHRDAYMRLRRLRSGSNRGRPLASDGVLDDRALADIAALTAMMEKSHG